MAEINHHEGLAAYFAATDHDLLSHADEIALARAYRAGDQAARETLITQNLRLAARIAATRQGRGLSYEDLIQEASLGLMRAVEGFDPERGLRFSTYATWWIAQRVDRAIDEHATTIRLPVHLRESITKLNKAAQALAQAASAPPDDAALAGALGWPIAKVERVKNAARACTPRSLDERFDDDIGPRSGDPLTLYDCLPSPADDLDAPVAGRDRRELVAELLALLPERERSILRLRHGLDGRGPRTLEQIGRELGLTRERVRQLEAGALERLRTLPGLSAAAPLLEAA